MTLSEDVRNTLTEVGQVAVEVSCAIDGYREFASVYATPRDRVINFEGRFPYLGDVMMLYRCIRFRVKSELFEQDAEVGPHDLVGMQEIFLPSEDDVAFVLRLWRISQDELLSPRQVEIPV